MKLLLITLFLYFPFLQNAQCDTNLIERAKPGNLGYQSRGNYCEGIYEGLTSNLSLEIVHFTKGSFYYPPDQGKVLPIYLLNNSKQEVNVRGVDLSPSFFYQMDAKVSYGDTLNWNTGLVLINHHITKSSNHVGLFGYIQGKPRKIYVPLTIKERSHEQRYIIKFMASKNIEQVSWKLKGLTTYELLDEGKSYGTSEQIKIDVNYHFKPGSYTLMINGYESDGTFVTKKFKIKI